MRMRNLVLGASALAVSSVNMVEAQSPDRLIPEFSVNVTLGGSARIGTCNRVMVLVTNSGGGTTGEVTVAYATWDMHDYEIRDTSSRKITRLTLPGLAAGETRTITLPEVMIGSYGVRVEAYVDVANRYAERTEYDNDDIEFYRPTVYCHTYTIDDVSVAEGGVATFTIRRGGGTGPRGTQYINYRTENGTATGGSSCSGRSAGADYIATTGTVAFGRYVTSKTVTVQTCPDRALEGAETFTVLIALQPSTYDPGTMIAKRAGIATVR